MDIFNIAKAVDTVGWFMGSFAKASPLLEEAMHKSGTTGIGFFMHDGSYYQIRFNEVSRSPLCK